jgi:uncharacterized protein
MVISRADGLDHGFDSRLAFDREAIARFCQRHHIRRLALFGSVLRDDFRPDSDVDVLVDFEPGHAVGLIRLAGIERELGSLIGRRIDLRTAADLSRYFRQEVVEAARELYAAA